ncbi:MAG: hypothetical protein N2111_01600 [Candidatus Sumerlaeaceae bacterium]|nr:hypothetical protein [Candidatus Sumerlaeaceae bacterium]
MGETILVLAHTNADGALPKPALEALAAAKTLAAGLGGCPITIGLFGKTVSAAVAALGGVGVTRILTVASPHLAEARYATDAAAAEAIAKAAAPTVLIAPATSRLSRIAAGLAQRLGGRADTHATGLEAADGIPKVTRWYYRQRMVADIRRQQRPWVITVDPGSFPPAETAAGTTPVEEIAVTFSDGHLRTRVEGFQSPPGSQQTIRPDAALLFVAGAGWTKKQRDGQSHIAEAEKIILDFLRKSGASLGSSKSLADQTGEGHAVLTFMSHLNQVGQTGSTPRHPKGLATCCHGEEPHVVGWRFINERRAINTDPNCGWAHGKADVLYVADAFEVMRKVNELL